MTVRLSDTHLARQFAVLDGRVRAMRTCSDVRFLHLGDRILRVEIADGNFLIQMDTQFTWIMSGSATHWDATLKVWREPDVAGLIPKGVEPVPGEELKILSPVALPWRPSITISSRRSFVEGFDAGRSVYYYGVRRPEPEHLVAFGHLFMRTICHFMNTPITALAHGACAGIGGRGVFLCAVGSRGKSTLTVHALKEGCEYVSDDYQILERSVTGLVAHPVYSIVCLSDRIRSLIGDGFRGGYVAPNGRGDKGIYEISEYRDQVRFSYPVRACLALEIASVNQPCVIPCTVSERGRAIAQFAGSTARQTFGLHEPEMMKKLISMVSGLPFYKIVLSQDLEANVGCFKKFLRSLS